MKFSIDGKLFCICERFDDESSQEIIIFGKRRRRSKLSIVNIHFFWKVCIFAHFASLFYVQPGACVCVCLSELVLCNHKIISILFNNSSSKSAYVLLHLKLLSTVNFRAVPLQEELRPMSHAYVP